MILPHVSASQITTYRSCPRLWAFVKVAKEKVAERSFQGLGKDIHTVLEMHEIFGAVPEPVATLLHADAIPRARSAFELLPPPGTPGVLLEHEIGFEAYEGGPLVVGYQDLIRPPRYDAGGVVIGIDDHKSTSDFKWAKTEDELKVNTQMMLYAYWAFRMKHLASLFPVPPMEEWRPVWDDGVDVVELAHNYIRTKGAYRSRRVQVSVEWPHVAKQWAGICGSIEEMVKVAAAEPNPMDVPGDSTGEMCRAYRGCEFARRCPEASQPKTLVQLFGKKPSTSQEGVLNMATMEELKARLAARMTAGAATAPPTPPAEAAAAQASVAAPPAVAPALPADAPPVQITPPDAPPRVNTGNEPELQPAELKPAKRGPGRPKKHEVLTYTPEQGEAAKAVAEALTTVAAPRVAPRVLYINTRPIRGRDVQATYVPAWEIWMAEVLRELHDDLKVLDYRLVDYGKGRGALTAFLKAKLPSAPEVCIVSTSHPEASDFLAVAIPLAEDVVGVPPVR